MEEKHVALQDARRTRCERERLRWEVSRFDSLRTGFDLFRVQTLNRRNVSIVPACEVRGSDGGQRYQIFTKSMFRY